MVKFKNLLLSGLIFLFFVPSIYAQNQAQLQFIHNSADSAIKIIDVYLNGILHLDNFEYLDATSFDTVTAGVPLNIGVAPGTSVSVSDTVKNFSVTLITGRNYVAIAAGVLQPTNFATNPDAISTAFKFFFIENARNLATTGGNVDFAIFHGSTDFPTVDIAVRGGAQLVNDAGYGSITSYQSLAAADYVFDITDAAGSTLLAYFDVPLSGIADSAAVIFSSGFLDTAGNQNGPGFGLFAALSTGSVLELQLLSTTAQLQFIHNSADSVLKLIDVYLNGQLHLDNLEYLDATSFDSVTAGIPLNIGIAPGNSVSVADTLKNYTVTLDFDLNYVAITAGVLQPANFAPNPDGISTAFNLFIMGNARKLATTTGNVDFAIFHGSTDAPKVDLTVRGGAQLVNDAAYGTITPYQSIAAGRIIFDISYVSGSTLPASFIIPFSGPADSAVVVFSSGFLDTAGNQNGPAFGLFAVVSTGKVIELEQLFTYAQLQFIHNSADSVLKLIDIYLNGELYLDNLEYLDVTSFDSVLADMPLNIGIAPGTSVSVADTLKNFPVFLTADSNYVAFAAGVLQPANFAPNPDGISTAFNLFIIENARKLATTTGNVDFVIFHGSTDAPKFDITVHGGIQLMDDAPYGSITTYQSLAAANYTFDISNASGSILFDSYGVPFSGIADSAAVIFTSGFLGPHANQFGPEFGLFAAFSTGKVSKLKRLFTPAQLQFIHNSADTILQFVDVYLNGIIYLDDFDYLGATAFDTVSADIPLNIGIAPGNSVSAADTLKNFILTLNANGLYRAMTTGVLDTALYRKNPEKSRDIGFNLFIEENARVTSLTSGNVDFAIFPGVTDAGPIDIVVRELMLYMNNTSYATFIDYISLPAADYTIDITDASVSVTYATVEVPFSGLADSAVVVFTSGFVDPFWNLNGEGFSVFVVLPSGQFLSITELVVGVEQPEILTVTKFDIAQNYPNPFNSEATISFSLPKAEFVTLKVYNMLGQEVVSLLDKEFDAGLHKVRLNAGNLDSGIYLYKITAGRYKAIRKMILLK